MIFFSDLHKWLGGSFTCRKCGREMHAMTFGFGYAICPDCYNGERRFISFDEKYWLNRIVNRLLNQKESSDLESKLDLTLVYPPYASPEIEIT